MPPHDEPIEKRPTYEELEEMLIAAWKANVQFLNMMGTAWIIIANAYGGDWSQASPLLGWQDSARRWREEYHTIIGRLPVPSDQVEEEMAWDTFSEKMDKAAAGGSDEPSIAYIEESVYLDEYLKEKYKLEEEVNDGQAQN